MRDSCHGRHEVGDNDAARELRGRIGQHGRKQRAIAQVQCHSSGRRLVTQTTAESVWPASKSSSMLMRPPL
jgi:hypothetical protein